MVRLLPTIGTACLLGGASAFSPISVQGPQTRASKSSTTLHASSSNPLQERIGEAATALLSFGLLTTPLVTSPPSAYAADTGASTAANSKITTGGASTLQSGRVSIFLYTCSSIFIICNMT